MPPAGWDPYPGSARRAERNWRSRRHHMISVASCAIGRLRKRSATNLSNCFSQRASVCHPRGGSDSARFVQLNCSTDACVNRLCGSWRGLPRAAQALSMTPLVWKLGASPRSPCAATNLVACSIETATWSERRSTQRRSASSGAARWRCTRPGKSCPFGCSGFWLRSRKQRRDVLLTTSSRQKAPLHPMTELTIEFGD